MRLTWLGRRGGAVVMSALLGILIPAALFAADAPATQHATTAPARHAATDAAPITGVLAHVPGGNTVGGEVREAKPRGDGYYHIDTPRMIARLKELHANNVNYLIWNSPSDFDDLRNEFLPAAQDAGINVWVYLVPPGETYKKASYPFKTDYVQWAKTLAELSLRYPVLQAWVMDDFTFAAKTFTPAYVADMQDAAHAINPKLRFFAVLLPVAVTEQWVKDFGPVVDGVVAPYFNAPYNDTQRTTSLDAQIDSAHALLKAQTKSLYFLIYIGRHLYSPLEPTPEYASRAIGICVKAMQEGRLEGVVSYGTPLAANIPPTRNNHALDGNGCLSLAMAATTCRAGDWAAGSQSITVDPKAPRHWLSFWHNDGWGVAQPKGTLLKEVLIDDQIIWHQDAASDGTDTWLEGGVLEGPVDVTNIVKGKTSAKLTLRLRTMKDFSRQPINVEFDRVGGSGITVNDGGFETGAGWKITDSGGALVADVEQYDPNRPAKVFDAVAKAFAARAGH